MEIDNVDLEPARENSGAFGEIAISLSGGGYRAAAFHLGVLDMLERLGILKDVRSISTISGGTIAGMFYAVAAAEGWEFHDYYKKLRGFLIRCNVVSESFQLVSQKNKTNRSNSLIRAAANVYASRDFLSDRKLGLLFDSRKSHFREQVFNATDFLHGVSFRFLESESDRAVIGNSYSSVPKEVAREIRLADIVAASSCFPSVFEPLAFPDDFCWDRPLDEVTQKLGNGFKKPIALMDGGIYDNQGIDSVLQIYRRKNKNVDLFLVSDVDNRGDVLYELEASASARGLSLRGLVILAWVLFVYGFASLTVLTAFAYVSYLSSSISPSMLLLMFGIPFLFTASILVGMMFTRVKFKELDAFARKTAGVNLWDFLKCLTIPELSAFARGRISSLIALSSTIFMKRIRDLTFYNLFTHPKYREKLVPVVIYDLLDVPIAEQVEDTREDSPIHDARKARTISKELHDVVEQAKKYETNLWFFDEQSLSNLICCGQATACFNILKFLDENRSEQLEDAASREAKLKDLAANLWKLLNREVKPLGRPAGGE